jgi:hypothetical protein
MADRLAYFSTGPLIQELSTPVLHRDFVNPDAPRMTASFFWAVMRDETLALHAGFEADPATKALTAVMRGLLRVTP